MKKFSVIAILAIMLMSIFAVGVSAQRAGQNDDVPVQIQRIWVDGDVVYDNPLGLDGTSNDGNPDNICEGSGVCETETVGDLMRGEEVTVRVKFLALEDNDDVELELEADVDGVKTSRYKNAESEVRLGETHEGNTYKPTIKVTIPEGADDDDNGFLRLRIEGDRAGVIQFNIPFRVNSEENKLTIDRVLFSPGQTVEAGRSLFTHVRVENFGQNDEDNVFVSFEIPELGVKDSAFIEEIEENDEKISQELFVSIPVCAEGEYEAKVTVEYDNDFEKTTQTYPVYVLASSRCKENGDESQKTVLTAVASTQNLARGGAEAVYPIALTNAGTESTTYTFEAVSGNGVNVRLSDNLVVLGAGETKVVSAMVSAGKEAPVGPATATVLVKSGETLLEQVTLNANVQDSGNSALKQGLTIGLIVLVVLLVILGLIIGFSRLKDDEDFEDDESDDKTYY